MSYKKPTLVEIFARISFGEGSLPQNKIIEIVPLLQKNGLEVVEISQVLDQKPPLTPELATMRQMQPRIRCWDSGRLKTVQLSPDLVIINQSKEYLGWSSYSEFLTKTLATIEEVGVPPQYTYSTLQTKDEFSVPSEGFSVDQWLKTDGSIVPQMYAGVATSLDIVLGHGYLDVDGTNQSINISARRRGDTIDFVFECAFSKRLSDDSDLEDVLNDLHDRSTNIFEGIITDNVRANIMEGEQ